MRLSLFFIYFPFEPASVSSFYCCHYCDAPLCCCLSLCVLLHTFRILHLLNVAIFISWKKSFFSLLCLVNLLIVGIFFYIYIIWQCFCFSTLFCALRVLDVVDCVDIIRPLCIKSIVNKVVCTFSSQLSLYTLLYSMYLFAVVFCTLLLMRLDIRSKKNNTHRFVWNRSIYLIFCLSNDEKQMDWNSCHCIHSANC